MFFVGSFSGLKVCWCADLYSYAIAGYQNKMLVDFRVTSMLVSKLVPIVSAVMVIIADMARSLMDV